MPKPDAPIKPMSPSRAAKELTILKELFDSTAMSDEDYDKAKARVISALAERGNFSCVSDAMVCTCESCPVHHDEFVNVTGMQGDREVIELVIPGVTHHPHNWRVSKLQGVLATLLSLSRPNKQQVEAIYSFEHKNQPAGDC